LAEDPIQERLEKQEYHKFLLAKSFFDCREYDRCAAVFLPATKPKIPAISTSSSPSQTRSSFKGKDRESTGQIPEPSLKKLSHKALFLSVYAKYLAGEKRKDEESEMILGPADGGMTINKELPVLTRTIGTWLEEKEAANSNGGGWIEYLYGVLLSKNKNEDLAKKWFLKSVHLCPYNWGAWQELSNLLSTVDELDTLLNQGHLPQHIMTFMFVIYTNQELGQSGDQVLRAIDKVEVFFPTSAFLRSQRALLHYHAKEFEESNAIFTQLLRSEPYRLDALDNYSNVLYVLDHRPRLAFLAQLAAQTDKFRPETCCIVGNYYSRNSEHEKAVMYFRRALTLDRCFQSAWTLMGHEYVEMKNTHAALESYRRAVDVNRKDYRAWHGIGLTYEMLEMHSYALFYHQRAAALRPFDSKTWQAVASCFAKVGKVHNSIRAYKRALVAGSYYYEGQAEGGASSFGGGILDPESLYHIALLYERLDNLEECAAYMELVLAQEEGSAGEDEDELGIGSTKPTQQSNGTGVGVTPTTSKARMWLAKWCFSNGDYDRASELANELCQDGVEVEEAKALIRDIRSRRQ
jgi:anaphase-promoting complex subunit 8